MSSPSSSIDIQQITILQQSGLPCPQIGGVGAASAGNP